MDLRLAFFASGNGSNVEAILENIKNGTLEAEAKIVVTNKPKAGVLEVARDYEVPYTILDDNILETLQEHDVNMIVLAGYLKKVSDHILDAYRVLNIHPSLLPKYGGQGMYGKHVHQAVINSNDKVTGVTVHLANSEYDEGEILAQCQVNRYPNDTVDSLATRVLKYEHTLYSQVLRDIQQEKIKL